MKYVLAPEHRGRLAECARPDALLAFDYDGTLAPIVSDPAQAEMRASTRRLLTALARRVSCVVITGRSRLGALRFLQGIPLLEVIGNHGLETQGIQSKQLTDRVHGWRATLDQAVAPLPGVLVEDKGYSLAVHYRASRQKPAARKLIMAAARQVKGARLIGGKDVINLVPEEAADKGEALLAVCARLNARQVLYVGDDDTDEDVFSIAAAHRILGVRVGRSSSSQAAFYLRNQAEVDLLLESVLAGLVE